MNCVSWQRMILLSETGELPPSESDTLAAHLTACAECRAFAKTSGTLQRAAHQATPRQPPSDASLQAIREEASRQATRGRLIRWESAAVWAACAAALLIAIGAWGVIPRQPGASSLTLAHLHALAFDLTGETAGNGSAENGRPLTEEEHLRRLAQQLLRMEGFVTEETAIEADEVETVSPTVLLPRSTRGLATRRCG